MSDNSIIIKRLEDIMAEIDYVGDELAELNRILKLYFKTKGVK